MSARTRISPLRKAPRRAPIAWPVGLQPVAELKRLAWGDDAPETSPGTVDTSRSGVKRLVWPGAARPAARVGAAPHGALEATLELTHDGLALIAIRDLPRAWLDEVADALDPVADGYLEARRSGTLWRIDLVDRSLTLEADPEESEEDIL